MHLQGSELLVAVVDVAAADAVYLDTVGKDAVVVRLDTAVVVVDLDTAGKAAVAVDLDAVGKAAAVVDLEAVGKAAAVFDLDDVVDVDEMFHSKVSTYHSLLPTASAERKIFYFSLLADSGTSFAAVLVVAVVAREAVVVVVGKAVAVVAAESCGLQFVLAACYFLQLCRKVRTSGRPFHRGPLCTRRLRRRHR